MAFNPVIIKNDTAYLTDAEVEPILLWKISPREIQAEALLKQLHSSADSIICIGCEFLPYLKQYSQLKKIILIEKSQPYLLTYCQTKNIKLEDYKNLQTCTTTLGIETPYLTEIYFKNIFYTSEYGELLLQLYQAIEENPLNYQLLSFNDNASDASMTKLLQTGVQFTKSAKSFHQEKAIQFKKPSHQLSPSSNIIWIKSASLEKISLFNTDFSDFHIQEFCLTNQLPSIFHHNAKPSDNDTICSGYIQLMTQFWEMIETHQPHFILFYNFAPFTTLESYLFLFKLIETLNLPIKTFFIDFLNIAGTGFRGGDNYLLYTKYGLMKNMKMFHPDPVNIKLFNRHPIAFHFYYQNLTERVEIISPPLNSDLECVNDISIIHSSRISYQSDVIQLLQEHYEYLQNILNDPTGNVIYKYWYQFRYFINRSFNTNSIYLIHWLNTIDWYFYSIIRIFRVSTIYNLFKHQFKIKVYGEGWNSWLPETACGGNQPQTALADIYRKSLVSVDLNLSNTKVSPHINAIECLTAGGLPLIMDVTYPEDKNDFKHQLKSLNPDHLIFIKSYQEIADIIGQLKNTPGLRKERIQTMQKNIVNDVFAQGFHQTLAALEKSSLPFVEHDPKMNLTHLAPDKLNTFFQTSLGYVYRLMGFPHKALTIWTQNIQAGEQHPLILYRTAKTAKELGQMELFKLLYDQLKNLKQYDHLLTELLQ